MLEVKELRGQLIDYKILNDFANIDVNILTHYNKKLTQNKFELKLQRIIIVAARNFFPFKVVISFNLLRSVV